jgi:hypothetical protein
VPNATHITNTNGGHEIHKEQLRLVIDSIRQVVDAVRSEVGTQRAERVPLRKAGPRGPSTSAYGTKRTLINCRYEYTA